MRQEVFVTTEDVVGYELLFESHFLACFGEPNVLGEGVFILGRGINQEPALSSMYAFEDLQGDRNGLGAYDYTWPHDTFGAGPLRLEDSYVFSNGHLVGTDVEKGVTRWRVPRVFPDRSEHTSTDLLARVKHYQDVVFSEADPSPIPGNRPARLRNGLKGEGDDREQTKNFGVGGVNLPSGQSFDLLRRHRHPPLLAEIGLFGGLGVLLTLLLYKGLSVVVDATESRWRLVRSAGFLTLALGVLWLLDYLGRVLS